MIIFWHSLRLVGCVAKESDVMNNLYNYDAATHGHSYPASSNLIWPCLYINQ